ncbi:lysophospholipid acyltransferase family protein [Succinispira mobilis]|uniref:lysophospholipid acyltransferase family protein n=1 Tax=Succinispira mobilis TaxID=78120 RepID=UPI0003731400|nr:lysophospholipid acyltransferase family protein [Succinispira mobilis]
MWQYHFIKLVSKLVCLLPYSVILLLGKWAGGLYYLLAKKQVNRALETIKECLGLDEVQARKIIYSMCQKLGKTFLEVLYIPNLNKENIQQFVKIEHPEYLHQALAKGRGVVALAAHISNWEWLGAALALNNFPLTSMVKRQPNEQHTRILTEYREMTGIETFLSGTNDIIAAARALKKGKVLGFIADQDAGPEGIFVPFLGKMASTPAGPAFFAKKFKAPIVPMFIVRCPEGGHKIIMQPAFYYEDTGNEAADMLAITAKMVKVTEDVIKQYPDNWLWFQKRWNTPYKLKEAEGCEDKP